jgi:hypothetical protein
MCWLASANNWRTVLDGPQSEETVAVKVCDWP